MHKAVNIIGIIVLLFIVLWLIFWLFSHKRFAVEYGISFNQNHASDLGLDWKKVYTESLNELRPKHLRVAAMWSDVEPVQGQFDFSNVDFMMDEAEKRGVKVLLVVGQKAPRWPECHVPGWFSGEGENSKENLLRYAEEVVKRYKNHPALESWQVENEPFIGFKFGACAFYDKTLVYDEIALLRSLDTFHKVVVTDSGELSTWRKASKAGDIFGTTVYRIVRTPGGMVFSYDWMPAGFYRLKARFWGRGYEDFIVSELQAEPWFTDSNPMSTSVEIQEKTMNPDRLRAHIDYVERIGANRAYFWGVEWWYFMKEERADSRYWDMIQELMSPPKVESVGV
ncbi:MAG: beta-galactosidase [Candidatus Magasanikbacteria bacterium]|nr:beta-galactosidase [Candidatus Magasanikbacteria bacterium]